MVLILTLEEYQWKCVMYLIFRRQVSQIVDEYRTRAPYALSESKLRILQRVTTLDHAFSLAYLIMCLHASLTDW